MFGFLLGSACLLGLLATFRRGHCFAGRGGHGCHSWHGGRSWHDWHHGHNGHNGHHGCGGGYGEGHGYGRGPGGYGAEDGPSGEHEGAPERGAGWAGCEGWGRRGAGEGGAPTGFGERAALRALFERLDTTPGQEKVIAQALAEFRKVVREARPEWKGTREDVGRALRAESFDAVLLGEMFARHDRHLEEVRKAFVASMDKIHVALEPQQRERLAALIEEGWFRSMWRFGRPYR